MSIAAILSTMVVPAMLPAFQSILRGIAHRLTGGAGAKPATFDEALKWEEMKVRMLEAMWKHDTVANVSGWVANVRAMVRPGIAAFVTAIYAYYWADGNVEAARDVQPFVSSVWFYLFGDRTMQHLTGGDKAMPSKIKGA
jgi:hypothetical protein